MLSPIQYDAWKKNRHIKLDDFYHLDASCLSNECDFLHSLPETQGKWMKYYENASSGKQLCRIENFIEYAPFWKNLLTGHKIQELIANLFGEPGILFKEKINFKLSGAKGFTPHQDAPAFISFKQSFHITLMIAIDDCRLNNGCLQVAKNPPRENITLDKNIDGSLAAHVCADIDWQPIECQAGDILLFDSYLPHYSEDNNSQHARRAVFATYNRVADGGDKRAAYYADKREKFPPEFERIPGKDYSAGAAIYNVANPIPVKERPHG